jgi:MarR family transcriptional regulator, lower aerobic nicotinate degradation pathway regulator
MSSSDFGLEASPGYLLARIGAESRRRWSQGLASLDLRTAHFGLLMTLGAAGPTSQRRLAGAIGIDPRNLVLVIDQLEERGLLERTVDPGDRRRHSVRLTPAGRKMLAELARVGAEAEADLLAALDDGERRRLQELLVKLLPSALEADK